MALPAFENIVPDFLPAPPPETADLAIILDHPTKERQSLTTQALVDWNRRNTEAGYGFYGIEGGERRGSYLFSDTPQH